jgi:two-component system LytT family response regulator
VISKIRTLVVDDEPIARQRVMSLLRDENDIEVIGEYSSGHEALSAIEGTSPDLLFLDIQMPEINGLDLARIISASGTPAVVFVTAYDEYALGAFEVHALDYLLKPFSAERFRSAVSRARDYVAQRRATTAPPASALEPPPAQPGAQPPPPAQQRNRLVIRSSGRIYFVRTADIDWCEAAGNYVRVHTGAQSHLVRDTMSHLESQLDTEQFVRIHRSTIVNVDRIQEIRSSFHGEYVVTLRGGTRVTLSRGYRDSVQARLGKFL